MKINNAQIGIITIATATSIFMEGFRPARLLCDVGAIFSLFQKKHSENWFNYQNPRITDALEYAAPALFFAYFAKRIQISKPLKQNEFIQNSSQEIKSSSKFLSYARKFFSIVITPLSEEILFRGFIQSRLEKYIAYSNVAQAIIFGLCHITTGQLSEKAIAAGYRRDIFLATALSGYIFGFVKMRQGSLVLSTITHIVNNQLL